MPSAFLKKTTTMRPSQKKKSSNVPKQTKTIISLSKQNVSRRDPKKTFFHRANMRNLTVHINLPHDLIGSLSKDFKLQLLHHLPPTSSSSSDSNFEINFRISTLELSSSSGHKTAPSSNQATSSKFYLRRLIMQNPIGVASCLNGVRFFILFTHLQKANAMNVALQMASMFDQPQMLIVVSCHNASSSI